MGLYRLLDTPWIFNLSQAVLAPGHERLQQKALAPVFAGSRGLVLDVGCGPRLTTLAPVGTIVGVDLNEEYVRAYTGGHVDTDLAHPSRPRLGFVASSTCLPFPDGVFDEARCRMLFHHLPDDDVRRTVAEMRRCVKPEGRLVVVDSVWPASRWRFIAWLVRKYDRGQHMRSEEQLAALVGKTWRRERYTYTYNGLEGVVLISGG